MDKNLKDEISTLPISTVENYEDNPSIDMIKGVLNEKWETDSKYSRFKFKLNRDIKIILIACVMYILISLPLISKILNNSIITQNKYMNIIILSLILGVLTYLAASFL